MFCAYKLFPERRTLTLAPLALADVERDLPNRFNDPCSIC